ncbi:uncharacterized protein LOC112449740 [Kryptolebias marmoratus]|uniref:uncharacterized protein LOC112449740 n=1 Tax=Kryptolebias marmoratus TaxID=37003 RepID=UPI000D530D25|nr:uncharacterized protein LOC112449740 [Kryptolebias marmoratus]
MTLLWATLLLLRQAHALVPVITVQLGEPVTLTCVLSDEDKSSSSLHWYKQSAGESLKLILTLTENNEPVYGPESPASRLKATHKEKVSNLTILTTVQEDEGIYHCAITSRKNIWHGTYLSIKGNSDGTSNYTVVEQRTSSDPDRPGGSVSLQCSVLSDSDNKTCSGGLRVFWFRSRSDKSYPDIIYADGNRHDECEKKPDSQKRCVFSKNISSSDAGTYYCAVATCGQILFGKGTRLGSELTADGTFIPLVIVLTCLGISVILNIVFFCHRTSRAACTKARGSTSSQPRQNKLSQPNFTNEDGEDLNYAALHFSGGKTSREKKKKELKTEESVYSQVKLCK